MLHLLGDRVHEQEDHLLRGMFEARKRVFVDLLGWEVPVLAGRYEVDQFDTEAATYVIVTDREGAHEASARLLPTTRPHILDTLFPSLCGGRVPRGPETFEITRFCLERRLDARRRRQARDELVLGLAHAALERGISRYTGVAEAGWLRQILGFGWECRRLGSPQNIGGRELGALIIEITSETPALLTRAGIGSGANAGEQRHAA
nr:acyl-homoserine-lactone synthase [uncultured Sphingomonas sp.]